MSLLEDCKIPECLFPVAMALRKCWLSEQVNPYIPADLLDEQNLREKKNHTIWITCSQTLVPPRWKFAFFKARSQGDPAAGGLWTKIRATLLKPSGDLWLCG